MILDSYDNIYTDYDSYNDTLIIHVYVAFASFNTVPRS